MRAARMKGPTSMRAFALGLTLSSVVMAVLYYNGEMRLFWTAQAIVSALGFVLFYLSFHVAPKPAEKPLQVGHPVTSGERDV
jgi:hypothetical protein